MAPSTRTSANRATMQHATIRNFTKVTKLQTVKTSKNVTAHKLEALSNIVNQEKPPLAPSLLKRKRSDEGEEGAIGESEHILSRQSLPFLSPPSSTRTDGNAIPAAKRAKRKISTTIPEPIQDLHDIFKYFVRAFSIHIAHNGHGCPAGLDTLLATITRLYKKRNITREDAQRMLAFFEVPVQSLLPNRSMLLHKDSPFKLVISGVGSYARHMVEYSSSLAYNEKFWIKDYADAVETVWISGRNIKESFVHGSVDQFPMLAYERGAQTAVRQAMASAVRDHVLGRQHRIQENESAEPAFDKLSINDKASTKEPVEALPSTKSRTLSLFDRVKAKQSAASLTSAPTSADLLRRHAIGRIGDIVEILRMKQNQRATLANVETATTSNKVSFSMGQTLALIKSSLSVPMADEEIRLCVRILATEVPGSWMKIVEMGSFQSVIIQGQALSGTDVRTLLQNTA